MHTAHTAVLLQETVEMLALRRGDRVVDATVGGGNLLKKLCDTYGASISLVGIDADEAALLRARELLKHSSCRFVLQRANFSELELILDSIGYRSIERIAFDLGLSSDQLENSERGFSFRKEEPLIMTFSSEPDSEGVTAYDIVNTWDEDVLQSIVSGYGEERYSRRISKAIVEERANHPIKSTTDLVSVIERAVPASYRHGRIHPATRTFQALRIAVNDELTALEKALDASLERLTPGGRIAVISFHSLEDRIVKRFFRRAEDEGYAQRITKKPIYPTEEEVNTNPRARSSKLRVLEKK